MCFCIVWNWVHDFSRHFLLMFVCDWMLDMKGWNIRTIMNIPLFITVKCFIWDLIDCYFNYRSKIFVEASIFPTLWRGPRQFQDPVYIYHPTSEITYDQFDAGHNEIRSFNGGALGWLPSDLWQTREHRDRPSPDTPVNLHDGDDKSSRFLLSLPPLQRPLFATDLYVP